MVGEQTLAELGASPGLGRGRAAPLDGGGGVENLGVARGFIGQHEAALEAYRGGVGLPRPRARGRDRPAPGQPGHRAARAGTRTGGPGRAEARVTAFEQRPTDSGRPSAWGTWPRLTSSSGSCSRRSKRPGACTHHPGRPGRRGGGRAPPAHDRRALPDPRPGGRGRDGGGCRGEADRRCGHDPRLRRRSLHPRADSPRIRATTEAESGGPAGRWALRGGQRPPPYGATPARRGRAAPTAGTR